jgi:hypothetical protein
MGIFLRILLFIALFPLILSCATGYRKPDKPPPLGPDGWPVGIWENESGNTIELFEDGTGVWTNKKTGTTNRHLLWRYENSYLRVDRWITNLDEALSYTERFDNKEIRNPLDKTNKQIRHYLVQIQEHDWWVFTVAPSVLNGTHYGQYRYYNWNGAGDLTKIEYRGQKSKPETYNLVELTSSQYRAKELAETEKNISEVDKYINNVIGEIISKINQKGWKRIILLNLAEDRISGGDIYTQYIEKRINTAIKESSKINSISIVDKTMLEQAFDIAAKSDNYSQRLLELTGADTRLSYKFLRIDDKISVNIQLKDFPVSGDAYVAQTIFTSLPINDPKYEAMLKERLYKLYTSGDIFYRENFSSIDEGEVPLNWKGIHHFLVRKESSGKKMLTSFQKGPALFTIEGITFPKNWSLKVKAKRNSQFCNNGFIIKVGNLKAGVFRPCGALVGNFYAIINDTNKVINALPENKIFELEVVQENKIIKLLLNGEQVLVARHDNYRADTSSLKLELSNKDANNQVSASIYEITGVVIE